MLGRPRAVSLSVMLTLRVVVLGLLWATSLAEWKIDSPALRKSLAPSRRYVAAWLSVSLADGPRLGLTLPGGIPPRNGWDSTADLEH